MLFISFSGALLSLLQSFLKILLSLLDPRRQPEGSYEIGSIRLSVLPSVLPSFRLYGCFLGIVPLIFSKFWHGARIPCEVVRGRFRFSGKMGKWAQNEPKTGFFQFIGKFGRLFLLNLSYNENLYYLLCSCSSLIFGKKIFPEIWAKMFSANQIAGFFNQPYLPNKSMKQPDFLYVDTNSH